MNDLKEKGNDSFCDGDYSIAIDYYTKAINTVIPSDKPLSKQTEQNLKELKSLILTNESLFKCFNNRSQCYLNLNRFQEAIDDASKGNSLFD